MSLTPSGWLFYLATALPELVMTENILLKNDCIFILNTNIENGLQGMKTEIYFQFASSFDV